MTALDRSRPASPAAPRPGPGWLARRAADAVLLAAGAALALPLILPFG
ncbi:hypothetical protein [Methylobacterium sp. A54F]